MASGDEPQPPSSSSTIATPTTTATAKSPKINSSSSQSRESSPSRLSVLKPSDPKSKPNSGSLSPTRPAASAPASTPANKLPKPLSLNEAANKIINSDNADPAAATTSAGFSALAPANNTANGSSSMRWPTSPRIRSPPAPTSSRRNSASSLAKLSDLDGADNDATPTQPSRSSSIPSDQPLKSPVISPQSGAVKIPRGFSGLTSTLETVQEGDNSSSPTDRSRDRPNRPKAPEKQSSTLTAHSTTGNATGGEATTDVTDSETDGTKPKDPPKTEAQSATNKKNLAPPPLTKARPTTDGSSKNMIVETETVASIPQSTAPSTTSERNPNGKKDDASSVGAKPSREMLKPKRERKKASAKRPTVMSGPTSSKADIFEARVASAAEDDESDSDETFVYESNAPQEPRPRPPRHHSRTPSANSVHSLADHRRHTARPIGNLADGQRSVRHKRSMKFASSSQATEEDHGDRESGTVRAHRSKRSPTHSAQHHQQIHGFTHGTQHEAAERESPFSQASKARKPASAPGSRHSSKANTPNSGSPPPYSQSAIRGGSASVFDFDHNRSTSERDPLLGSLRSYHGRSSRKPYSPLEDSKRRWKSLRAYSGCCCICFIMLVVLVIAGGFLFATTHPLYDVSILEVSNILATEESLMADLTCIATNPNIVAISISDMDVNVFAKSRHVGPDAGPHHKQKHHRRPPFSSSRDAISSQDMHALDSVDDGTDPITDPQTMLLGRIFRFDSSLMFDPSPWEKAPQNSTGGLRVDKPGNSTEEDGSERWEKVIQYPFELIVRGVLKYTLPLSSRVVTSSVSKTVEVDPDDASGILNVFV